ncbi:Homeobox-leucine zipper protein HOX27 [Apostasia shenzhenica]|uniref:Homeobox-leucine zipper protein HOX27 n=1 Tax=Apostasia shenzhenica TaxID=1088818 RepID=A0A2H9ZUS2_9ASPA|nr:Homeobox-leucine zipper protein HOX27 [Apostasia shenzhenica]
MELELRLGDRPPGRQLKNTTAATAAGGGAGGGSGRQNRGLNLGFCVGLVGNESSCPAELPVRLDLLPLSLGPRLAAPSLGFPWASENTNLEALGRGLDVNLVPEEGEAAEVDPAISSSPPAETEKVLSRASDEEENSGARKKLRLSKEQSAFLEESFKEHTTLNPRLKLALAKQLNLRPRQVEVWFQNRRARTKLKQTEVDCEYLKRCCDALTEENRRLRKELSELRALKTSHSFFMQPPATTLSICAACERLPKSSALVSGAEAARPPASAFAPTSAKPRFFDFADPRPAPANQPSAAS